jgi:hypothetical protein
VCVCVCVHACVHVCVRVCVHSCVCVWHEGSYSTRLVMERACRPSSTQWKINYRFERGYGIVILKSCWPHLSPFFGIASHFTTHATSIRTHGYLWTHHMAWRPIGFNWSTTFSSIVKPLPLHDFLPKYHVHTATASRSRAELPERFVQKWKA